jgi:hypothetical protein
VSAPPLSGPPATPPATGTDRLTAAAIAVALFAIYSANGRISVAHDPHANACLAATFAGEGRLSFSASARPSCFEPGCYSYTPSMRADARTGERLFVSQYGPGAGLTAAPVALALRAVWGEFRGDPVAVGLAGKIAASLLCALTAALIFLVLRTWAQFAAAVGLALAYGLATTVWSASSQALWQHAPSSFFLAVGVWATIRRPGSAPHAALAGLALAVAVTCRPTMAVFLLPVGIAMLGTGGRRPFLAFVAGTAPILAALALHNAYFFGSPFRFGYLDASDSGRWWATPLLHGLAAVLVSPSRGLLIYTPFLVAGFAGAIAAWRHPEYAPLRPYGVGALALLIVHAKWTYWWGGHSYGPRILGEILVPLVVLIAPVLAAISRTSTRRTAFAAAVLWSLAVQAVGVAISSSSWNARPAREGGRTVRMDIDDPRYRWRLWSLRDNQLAYEVGLLACGFTRTLAGGDGSCATEPRLP